MRELIAKMTNRIAEVLCDNLKAGYLFGSAALGDYKSGWSDIDILIFTNEPPTELQCERLLMLRQEMCTEEENPHYRSFEGAILALSEFLSGSYTRLVYWGTSGQRITKNFAFDAFSMTELICDGELLLGEDIRDLLTLPTYSELRSAVNSELNALRQYAQVTDSSLYSCGFLLDIARCIYTLRTGKIIAKTAAGDYALKNSLCPNEEAMRRTLKLRNNPALYESNEVREWLCSLGSVVQEFADVLEKELALTDSTRE